MRYVIIILFLSAGSVNGQTNKDSLWNVWNDEKSHDTLRLKAIQALTWPMMNVNLDSMLILAKIQLEFAEKVSSKKWIARSYYNIGTHYYLKSEYPLAIENYNLSLAIRKELGDLKGEGAIYGNLGLIYGDQGNTMKNLEYQLKSLAINEKLNDTANITSNYSNLASIYLGQDDTTKALEYFDKALVMYQAQNAQRYIGIVYNNMGNMYRQTGNFEKAGYYLNESLRIRQELNDVLGTAISYVNLGTLYIHKREYDKAKENTLKSITYFRQLGDTASLANVYFNLGDIAKRTGKYNEAIKYCKQSFALAKEASKVNIESADCGCLYQSYKALGDHKTALKYYEQYVMLEDSLKEDELKIEMSRLEFEKEILTDSLSREAEKNALKAKHQQELNQRSKVTNVILISAVCALFFALLFLSRMFMFRRKSEKLKLKTQELEKQQLVNEISLLKTQVNPHFLFNSLSILSSLVRVDPDMSERFIDQLSKSYRYILEQKDQSLVTLRTELNFIDSYAFLLEIRFENKFNLQIDIPESVLDKYKIAPLTLQLLVENAVKHNRMSVSEPLIIAITMEEDVLVVRNKLQPRATDYKSTGVGLQNIMNRYALLTNRQVSAGAVNDEFMVRIPILSAEMQTV